MKQAKMLGLAALATTTLLAFAGVGSSSAATEVSWCHTAEGHAAEHGCPAGWTELNGQKVKLTAPSTVWTGGSFTTTCASTAEGTLGLGAAAMITSLTFTGCSGSCTELTAVNLPYSAQGAHVSGEEDGTLTVSGNPGWEQKHCTVFNVNCTYTKSSIGMGFNGSMIDPAKLEASVLLTRSAGSALCPAEGSWTATYTAQSGAGLTPLIALKHHT